ncbi:uncharacterized protein AB9W97_000364 isoform 2-T2 [Spinachia spinachia]
MTPRTEGGDSEMRGKGSSMVRMSQRMDSMEELLSLFRGSQSLPSAPVEDPLLSPCSTATELQELTRGTTCYSSLRRLEARLQLCRKNFPALNAAEDLMGLH